MLSFAAKIAVGAIWQVEEDVGGGDPGLRLEVALDDELGRRQDAGHCERTVIALDPLRRCGPSSGAADVADAAMPEREEVLGRRQCARPVRRRDGGDAVVEGDARVDDDERKAALLKGHELAARLQR